MDFCLDFNLSNPRFIKKFFSAVSRLVYQPETRLIAILTYRPEEYVGCNGVMQNNKHSYSRPSISVMGAKYASVVQLPQQQVKDLKENK